MMDSETQSIRSYISYNESPEIAAANESIEITTTNESVGVSVNEVSEVTGINNKRKRSKSESWVFKENHFTRHPTKPNYVQCTHCKGELKHDNDTGTSSLIRHMKNTKCQKYLKPNRSQQLLQVSTSGISTYKFSQEISRQDMAKMVVRHSYSFSMVEDEGFVNLLVIYDLNLSC